MIRWSESLVAVEGEACLNKPQMDLELCKLALIREVVWVGQSLIVRAGINVARLILQSFPGVAQANDATQLGMGQVGLRMEVLIFIV